MMRLLLVDDDPLARHGLRAVLSLSGVQIVGEARDGRSALRVLSGTAVDTVLMDVRMPGMNGIAAIRAIREATPSVRIVLMTSFKPEAFAEHAKVLGADGFVSKSASLPHLIAVLFGDREGSVSRRLSETRLSRREQDVATRIAHGETNEQIAQELVVSINTVKTYVSRLFTKFGVTNRVQLANALNGVGRRSPGNPTMPSDEWPDATRLSTAEPTSRVLQNAFH
jgi:DNA-binding NarL/FixJ family response regulator